MRTAVENVGRAGAVRGERSAEPRGTSYGRGRRMLLPYDVRLEVAARHNQPLPSAVSTASARLAAPVLPMAEDRWLRTVPSDRKRRAAIAATGEPSRAARRT